MMWFHSVLSFERLLEMANFSLNSEFENLTVSTKRKGIKQISDSAKETWWMSLFHVSKLEFLK